MIGYPVIDADGHLTEPISTYKERLPEPYRSARNLFPQDGWDRNLGRMGHLVDEPQKELSDLDVEGIDAAVVFPTSGLAIGILICCPTGETGSPVERGTASISTTGNWNRGPRDGNVRDG